jgi:hypothetical protein
MSSDGSFVHAWVLPHEIEEARWIALRYDAVKVLRAASARLEAGRPADAPGVLRGPEGIALPQVSEDRIAFNGSAFRGEAADPFMLEHRAISGVVVRAEKGSVGRAVRRCDTKGYPYDLAVCALLLTVQRHLADVMRLGTSGDIRHGWHEAAEVVRAALDIDGELAQSEQGLVTWAPGRERARRVRTSA